ncbi:MULTISPECIES: hypothetical protein [unclassified Streptomyces]|uniref:hypothetical protein n=1 Tax=unclassified Streptomyces TaxID=2593676 RepID=UPI002E10904B|nr:MULTISPECIES: hypothetical protein [unclassified Streptomyces]WSR27096.1 hypothetical protein OG573_13795 [Streptomyces sp. NBC_01205]
MTRPAGALDPRPAGARRAAVAVAAACAVLVFTVTGCTSSAAGTARPAPSAGGTGLVEPTPDVRQAYDAYWTSWLAAGRKADPDDPVLAQIATGAQLDDMRAMLKHFGDGGKVLRGEVGHRIDGMDVSGEQTRVVQDCVDLDRWLIYDRASGALADQLQDKPSQLSAFTLVRERLGAPWKVTSVSVLGDC